jgi:GT2 family glycosyltransferase
MLRRAALDAVGLLDAERFFPAFYADAEICYRLRRHGWAVRYIAGAVALHEETMTRDPADPRVRFLSNLQRLQFAMKHLERRVLLEEFLPREQETFLAPERYAKALEERCAVAEAYAADLRRAFDEAQTYARSLEQRARASEAYARALEERCAELERQAQSLASQRATHDDGDAAKAG